ncbi:MAG: hypothetical protein WD076_04530 [Parvularculaceae bacterium]
MRTIMMIAALFIGAAPAFAQSGAQTLPCQAKIFHDFDFWIGEWEVFDPQGKKAGDNSIKVEEYGCLLVERWVSAQGTTGQSYNFVDHLTGKWTQIWVSAGATIDYAGGLNDKGQMVLEGTIGYPTGVKAPFRGTWTPNKDGTVTQYFQQYNSETKAWGDWFTGHYKRKSAT